MLYGGAATVVLVLASGWETAAAAVVIAILAFPLSALAVSGALKLAEKDTIASFRRILALMFAGVLLWLVLVAVGGS